MDFIRTLIIKNNSFIVVNRMKNLIIKQSEKYTIK